MKVKILYIDDEVNNLISFKASFRLHFNIFTATQANEAVMILIENPDIKIIFCDQRMPDISGVDLLEQIKSLFPLPVRIMITGYADIDSVIGAINKGSIFQYIKKPWKEDDILFVIEEALKFYDNSSNLILRNKELKSAYGELDKFAYSVSHDIRGPLSGMLTGIDYILHSDDVDEIKELMKTMKKSLHQLDEYIIAMHQYYNNQKGQISVVSIDFDKLLAEIKSIYKIFAESHQINFQCTVVQTETFRSDIVSIKLIINNLLSNAFKYQQIENPHKKVNIDIHLNNGIATIIVEDNGIGIDEQDVEKIFDLHYRSASHKDGFGFGLFNLKGALMKLNGQIDVQSTLGKGTKIKVSLPSL